MSHFLSYGSQPTAPLPAASAEKTPCNAGLCARSAAPPVGPPDDGGLLELWRTFQRKKGTLLLLASLGALAGVLVTLPQAPVYRASGAIEIQGFNDDFLNIRNIHPTVAAGGPRFGSDIPSQIRILDSRSLTQKVAEKLTPGSRPKNRLAPKSAQQSSMFAPLKLPASPSRKDAVAMSRETLTVATAGDTRIVEIHSESTQPEVAAEFVNTLVSEFMQQNMESRWRAFQATENWLDGQLQHLRARLEESEQNLQRYARESGLMFTTEHGSVAEQRLRQLQAELSRAQADRITKQSRYERTRGNPPESLPEIPHLQTLLHFETQATDLRRKLAGLSATYTAQHPKVKETVAQIQEVERAAEKERLNVASRIRNDYEAAARREKLLSDDYRSQARLVSELADRSIQYNIYQREVDTNQQLYESLLQKVKQAGMAAAMSASNIRVVDPAEVPETPHKPNLALNSAMGSLCAFFLGAIFVFLRQQTDLTLKQPGDASSYLGVPELGAIPACGPLLTRHSPRRKGLRVRVLYGGRRTEGPILRRRQPAPQVLRTVYPSNRSHPFEKRMDVSTVAERFRAVLTSILHSGHDGRPPQVLVVTSPLPEEGKTSIASNLAVFVAEINRRVLVIDADLRKPRLHEMFDVSNSWGLTNLLQRRDSVHNCPFESIARETTVPGLYVLPSGPAVPVVSNLLHSCRTTELLDRVRREFDTVLIDTPPMMQLADARVIGPLADGVVLVLRAGGTSRDLARQSVQTVQQDGAHLLGTILNFWDPQLQGYGYSGSHAYVHHNRTSEPPAVRAVTTSSA